jgi:hypothetical protein
MRSDNFPIYFPQNNTLIERMRALGNEGDGVSSAFPEGKQNGEKKEFL